MRAEFLSRQLEEQRQASEARMQAQLRRSADELTGLGREVEELRDRCGRLSQGKSLALLSRRRRETLGAAAAAAASSSDEEA